MEGKGNKKKVESNRGNWSIARCNERKREKERKGKLDRQLVRASYYGSHRILYFSLAKRKKERKNKEENSIRLYQLMKSVSPLNDCRLDF